MSSFAQPNFKEQIQGTWSYVDDYRKAQQLIITNDTWTVNENWSLNKDNTKWQLVNFSGKYRFIKVNKIHVIYHKKPREQGFVVITEFLCNNFHILFKEFDINLKKTRKLDFQNFIFLEIFKN